MVLGLRGLGGANLLNWKIGSTLVLIGVCCSVILHIAGWAESRQILDDICYLRQADLFRASGWHGLDTDLVAGDAFMTKERLKAVGYSKWDTPGLAPCHEKMHVTGKYAMQYPPGTGFLLSVMPPDFQVRALYIASTIAVLLTAITAVWLAGGLSALALASVFGCAALYFMINPAKSSFSLAPTMAICGVLGLMTLRLVKEYKRPCLATLAGIGFLIGLSVNLRLPNGLLAAGYLVLFAFLFLRAPGIRSMIAGALFTSAMIAGMSPTLIANAINTGHPLVTAYSSKDTAGPELSLHRIGGQFINYAVSTQGLLLAWAIASCFLLVAVSRRSGRGAILGSIVGINLIGNLAFFLLHPIYTPYYAIPLAMLSLWTLLFAWEDRGWHPRSSVG